MPRERILIADDEPDVLNLCMRALLGEGYQVVIARNGTEALQRLQQETPDLVVLDILMPELNGVELCQRLRATEGLSSIPILLLTGKHDITDKAAGFAVGADDYLTKPFDLRELLMRVGALLRRASRTRHESRPAELVAGELRLDCHRFSVTTPEKTVPLTSMEFDLLYYLMSHPAQAHSSSELLQEVWGCPSGVGSADLVRAHIKNLRTKIEADRSTPHHIRSIRPHGYMVGE